MKAIVVVTVLLILSSCTAQRQTSPVNNMNKNPVIAHRGAFKKNGFPENSIASLKESIRLKCIGSEFDVHMTADDSLIISHDPHHGKLEIEKSAFSQVSTVPLSNGERIPTLREYLLAGKENNQYTKLILEIKPSGISKERGQTIA